MVPFVMLLTLAAFLAQLGEADSTVFQNCVNLDPATGYSTLLRRSRRSAEDGNDTAADEKPVSANIMGGTALPQQAWPFLVAILVTGDTLRYNGRYWDLVCGGALIHPQYVLTAAHCFVDESRFSWRFLDASNFVARVGDYDLVNRRVSTAATMRIVEYVTYPGFSYDTVEAGYDIAIAKLERPVNVNEWTQPACLPQAGSPIPQWNSPCLVAGWGSINRAGTKLSSYPRVTTLMASASTTCYNTLEIPQTAHDGRMFCAGDPQGLKDSCAGDSGGPTFCKRPNGQWELSGVVSFGGETCADADVPGAYTTVSFYHDWIRRTVTRLLASTPAPQTPQPAPSPSWYYYTAANTPGRAPWQTRQTPSGRDQMLLDLLQNLLSQYSEQLSRDQQDSQEIQLALP